LCGERQAVLLDGKVRQQFFFEKKNQKTFGLKESFTLKKAGQSLAGVSQASRRWPL
jgi:hypothetical protein